MTEDLRLMVLLDPEALSRMLAPETLLKDRQNILVRHGLGESFWGGQAKLGMGCNERPEGLIPGKGFHLYDLSCRWDFSI